MRDLTWSDRRCEEAYEMFEILTDVNPVTDEVYEEMSCTVIVLSKRLADFDMKSWADDFSETEAPM